MASVAAAAAWANTPARPAQASVVPISPPGTAAPAASTASAARIPSPQPGALDVEKAHVARFDAAINAVRSQALSPEDAERLRQAFSRIVGSDLAAAQSFKEQISEPIARKLVDWYRLRSGFGEPQEYREFLAQNPAWGSRDLMIQRFEEALFTQGGSSRAIKEQFKAEPPRTAAGHAALASAHLAEGDAATAARLARAAWREHTLAASLEAGFLDRFREQITAADHKWRLDRLLMDDPRWTSDRGERAAVIKRMLPLLAEGERKKAEARLAVFQRAGNAARLMAAIEEDDRKDWGLAFQRAQLLRRSDKIEEAAKRVLAAPQDANALIAPDAWWIERRTLAYAALRLGKPRLAYELAKSSVGLSVNPLKDQTFLAGWIALRHIGDAAAAVAHLEAMRKAADGPLSHAKAGYWLARALEAQGRAADAQARYKEAARFPDTFHGQLARRALGGEAQAIRVVPPAAPTAEQVARFGRLDAARAAVIARKAGLDASITRVFLSQLQRFHTTEAEVAMVAHLAEALGDTQMAVRIGKAAIARGFNLMTAAYPLHAFPSFTPLRTPTPEMALLLGLARQESEFNGMTASGAGARGILQVMPATARSLCRQYKIKCDIARLMKDDAYNTALGAAYVGDRMGDFKGSYILGIAGYNAGPGRARQWMREFGDPRDPNIDAVDWIHRIPFEETREYVQKVLSNVQVYRARLGNGAVRLMIAEDLARARGQMDDPGVRAAAADAGAEPRPGRDDDGDRDSRIRVFD